MKIGLLIEDYCKLGGVERVTSNLYKLLRTGGYDIQVVSLYKSAISENNYFREIRVDVLNDKSFFDLDNLENYLDNHKIDTLILQVSNLKNSNAIVSTANRKGIRVFVVFHNSPYAVLKNFEKKTSFLRYLKFKFYNSKINKFYLNRLIKNSNKFICVSEKCSIEFKYLFPNGFDKIIYINNPLILEKHDIVEKENILIYAGRLTEIKQVHLILEAWKILSLKFIDWKFVIIGNGDYISELERKVHIENIQNTEFVGAVNNVEEYLNKSKISVLFSLFEGFPTILLESAYYSNALVINSGFGGSSDIVINEFNGYVCKNSNVKELCSKLSILMSDDKILTQFMENSPKVLESFSHEKIISEWAKLFDLDFKK